MRIKIIEVLPYVESLKLEGRFEDARKTLEKELNLRLNQLEEGHIQSKQFSIYF
jgi:hypothetical protein